jgi:superfamily II DNA or RNA helicase
MPRKITDFTFPSDVRFRRSWRTYQARVLDGLDGFLNDGRVHVVAAPGSGKTVLGLEIVRRLNAPALILAPSLTIRDQWVDRFTEEFLDEGRTTPEWVSVDLSQPAPLTVVTYQALYAVCTASSGSSKRPDDDGDDWVECSGAPPGANGEPGVPAAILNAGFRTLVVDEAHHLRTEWWRVLTRVVDHLNQPTVVALTATPPYDVARLEWDRYESLCGPVDAEVSAPELVKSGDLCPHQDLLFCSMPSADDVKAILEHDAAVAALLKDLQDDASLVEAVARHAWVQRPVDHADAILDHPQVLSSLLIFLRSTGRAVPADAAALLGGRSEELPPWDPAWAEIFLTHLLFGEDAELDAVRDVVPTIHRRLQQIRALAHRTVRLSAPPTIDKLLTTNTSKIDSTAAIANAEWQTQQENLRLVVLADYIRAEELDATPTSGAFGAIGVASIFERLRREPGGWRLAVLSGSLIVLPSDLEPHFEGAARFSPLHQDSRYSRVEFIGAAGSSVVHRVTRLFAEGHFHVLVGTKALLGEGWDAPFVNALVLASVVGSFMLSNQMRGRSIRADRADRDKTANIWHMVCLRPGRLGLGPDYDTMARRFDAFVGLSARHDTLESGLERLALGDPSTLAERIDAVNADMILRAAERRTLARRWSAAIGTGEAVVGHTVAPADVAPRRVVFPAMLRALAAQAVLTGLYTTVRGLENARSLSGESLERYLLLLVAAGSVVALPACLYSVWLFVRHGTIERSFWQVAEVVRLSLIHAGVIRDSGHTAVKTSGREHSETSCWLSGATPREDALFGQALREVLDPIANPRYLLEGRSWFGWFGREDYHAVPEVLSRRRGDAEEFARLWQLRVRPARMVHTRSAQGRLTLLRARCRALTSQLRPRSWRLSQWQ